MMEVEGVGQEVVWLLCVLLLVGVLALAWLSTGLAPLDYDLFLVEMQTWRRRRIVQVLHVGYSEVRGAGVDLVRRLRARARRTAAERENRERAEGLESEGPPLVHSDTNVVIQSPATVVEPHALTRDLQLAHVIDGGMTSSSAGQTQGARLWEVEIPALESPSLDLTDDGRVPAVAAANESEIAAAAAIAVVNGRRRITTRLGDTQTEMVVSRVTPVPFDELVDEQAPPSSLGPIPPPAPHSPPITPTEEHQPAREVQAGAAPFVPSTEPLAAETPTVETLESAEPQELASVVRLPPGEEATGDTEIRLKFLDDTQKLIPVWLDSTVGEFKRRVFGEALSCGQVVRLIFKGQLLRDDARKLEEYGLHAGCVVHCHVSNTPYSQPRQATPTVVPTTLTQRRNQAQQGQGGALTAERREEGVEGGERVVAETMPVIEQLFALLLTLLRTSVRVLTGFDGAAGVVRGLEGAAEDAAREQDNQGFMARAGRWIQSHLLWNDEPEPPADGRSFMEEAADRAAAPPPREPWHIGDWMTLIFALQFAAMWTFVFLFPQFVDRAAIALLGVLSFGFFLQCRRQFQRAPELNVDVRVPAEEADR